MEIVAIKITALNSLQIIYLSQVQVKSSKNIQNEFPIPFQSRLPGRGSWVLQQLSELPAKPGDDGDAVTALPDSVPELHAAAVLLRLEDQESSAPVRQPEKIRWQRIQDSQAAEVSFTFIHFTDEVNFTHFQGQRQTRHLEQETMILMIVLKDLFLLLMESNFLPWQQTLMRLLFPN